MCERIAALEETDVSRPLKSTQSLKVAPCEESPMIHSIREQLIPIGIRISLFLYKGLMRVLKTAGPPQKEVAGRGFRILLTGQFYSANWVMAHLRPLALSPLTDSLRIVSSCPVPDIPKVQVTQPPVWLVKLLGATLARMAAFAAVAIITRPDVVGGFHLLLNGMLAGLLGRLVGARSLYFCVGGPAEVLDGGILSENRLFAKLKSPDRHIEEALLKTISAFDIVITMGSRAIDFFRSKGAESNFFTIAGGLDVNAFRPSRDTPEFDLIFVGRLVPIKRVDLFLEIVRLAKSERPKISAAVVGDGPLLQELKEKCRAMELAGNVRFLGFQADIPFWLKKAKLFVLTSVSEGLSLAMMEAMLCGLPAVVPRIGDLGDLVVDQVNGCMMDEPDPKRYADCTLKLLSDPVKLDAFSREARLAAEQHSVENAALKWNRVFESKRQAA